MIEYSFVRNGHERADASRASLSLVVYAVHVPMRIGFTSRCYDVSA